MIKFLKKMEQTNFFKNVEKACFCLSIELLFIFYNDFGYIIDIRKFLKLYLIYKMDKSKLINLV